MFDFNRPRGLRPKDDSAAYDTIFFYKRPLGGSPEAATGRLGSPLYTELT